MISFVPGHVEHIRCIKPQPGQRREWAQFINSPAWWDVVDTSLCISAFEGGVCLGTAGVKRVDEDSAYAWLIMSEVAGRRHLVSITRRVRLVLDDYPAKRIITYADVDFLGAYRWLEVLGFKRQDAVETGHVRYQRLNRV